MYITMICPVRNVSPDVKVRLGEYVTQLEKNGHKVHYPPRDVDQTDDGCGMNICKAHAKAIRLADEVHIWWDKTSIGSHFDFGMAFLAASQRPLKFVAINDWDKTASKSYGNVLKKLCQTA